MINKTASTSIGQCYSPFLFFPSKKKVQCIFYHLICFEKDNKYYLKLEIRVVLG